MPGIFGGLADTLGGLVSLPGNVIKGYSAGYAALPQRYADEAALRHLQMQSAMDMHGLIGGMFGDGQAALPQTTPTPAPATGPQAAAQDASPSVLPPVGPQAAAPSVVQAPPMVAPQAPAQPPGGMFGQRQQKALAAMALLKGDAKGAWDIMHPTIKIGPDGTPYNENDPAVLAQHFRNPAAVNNTVVDLNDTANTNRVIPTAPVAGAMPVYDNQGHVVDWSLPAGARGAIQSDATAKEEAKAGLDLVSVPRADGSSVMMPRAEAARLLGGGATPPAAAPAALGASALSGVPGQTGIPGSPAIGVTQSPDAAELAKQRAGTQGTREADMQGARAAAQQVDDQTNMIRQNLHDMLGETQDPNTGKWVKTKPSMITGLSSGSTTPLIEHIPFVGQSAHDLDAKIETVRNGTSFNSMQAIKNALQAAGNGSGASIRMTDQIARMLGEINGSLSQTQSPQQFEDTVKRHLSQLDALDKARHDLFAAQYTGIEQPTPGQTAPKPPAYEHGAPSRAALEAEARRRGLIH